MKRMLGLWALLFVLPVLAGADVCSVAPSKAVVLPSDDSGITKVAVQFDLSGMRSGEGRVIDVAMVEWTPSGVSSEEWVEFSAYAVSESWTTSSAAQEAPAAAESPAAEWEIDPTDYATNGGYVRFDVKDIVAAWDAGSSSNNGLILEMGSLNSESLETALDQIRLVVHYGFRP